ncbi:major facilitator superfamily-domain-containing protein [Melampsora americana]|nr:major facilitator superfamily-domain-containing protein [Melampsora americana]
MTAVDSATCEDSTLANRHVGQKDPESLASPEHAPQMSTFRCIAIIAVCISAFIVNSQLAINVILPVIQRELEINPCDLQWLSGGFSLGYGSLLLLSGRLSDIYGHKLFLQLGLFIFAISSLASALARTSIQLSIFRATMGVGSAVSAPALLGWVRRFRILAYAAFSAGAPLGSATGLLAGGFIVERTALTWRSFFYFCLAFSTLVMVFVTFIIPADDVHVKKDTVDWIGAGLIISGLALLILSLATGSDSRWAPAAILGIFFASLIVLIAFVAWEAYLERQETRWGDPLMKLSMFRRECFGVLQCIAALLWFGFVDANYFLNIFFEEYLELNLTETVVRFIPMLIVGILLNVIVGFLMKKWPAQILVVIGCAGTMISCLLMAITDPKSSYWGYSFLAIALSVVGADFVFAVGTMYGAKIASKNEQGVAGGIFQTFSQIGRAIGLSISTIVQVKVTKSEGGLYGVEVGADLNNAPRPIFLHGIRAGMWTCFASVALATLLAATCLNKMGYVGKQQGPTKTEPHK